MPDGRLLIIDDDPTVGHIMQLIAEASGMRVRFTASPNEFFELVASWQPSHIALDLVMPEMDGVQVLAQLARRGCRARIIITSGVGGRILDAAGRSAVEHGLMIAGVLPKPFSAAKLRGLLTRQTNMPAPFQFAAAGGDEDALPFQVTEQALHQALQQGELHVVYQPKVECESGELDGFEALVRWLHPEFGVIMPDEFVPFAESHGLIEALTEQVLDLSLAWFASSFAASSIKLSVNMSARSLKDEAFVERILARCNALDIEPTRLIIELTESSAMEDAISSLGLLTRLRMKGFQLSIDDFGTGFSSMLQLVRLPFSEIKVDKSFVMTALSSQESRAVVKSVVDLGHSLGLRATAEGVQDADTLRFLKDVGCDLAQGYFIGRPMPGDSALVWVASR